MAKVKVKYFGRLYELLGVREEKYDVENSTVADLLMKHIPNRHSEISKELRETIFTTVRGEVAMDRDTTMLKNYFILVNGLHQNLTYMLKDGDEVVILPSVEGGDCEYNVKIKN
ncbi:MAG: MoaD/ThiS family protein [archaeon YNP-LCB-003-016]|jgi:molybdopterin converting factor small subunit|uniref:MoaD/ThiS family protein n=1 Tax=Candidatus Culexarchaeum yellowstonense TaxID=2928963 RepID=UPI0026F31DA0|nr:MoaD/ThiS family protein [Candidatus Culexarchaeum yellowstonense]MCR6692749.1 MoaD/ThiS family protein [Candidatus Culexarchaeum yellowstonense]